MKKQTRTLPGNAGSEKLEVSRERREPTVALESPQATIERLRRLLSRIDHLPLPIGKEASALLDCLDLADRIRDKVRGKAKTQLSARPGSIPGWRVEEQWRRELKTKNGSELLELLQMGGYPNLSADDLLAVCNATLGGLEGLLDARLDDELVRTEPLVMLKQERSASAND